ncbi:MAG: MFS transporter [Caldiserica bacterium]|nr:MFS transporter [Caldisericota bacterium]
MEKAEYRIYPYRWVILLSMIPILVTINVFWLTFAPITDIAKDFYQVSPLSIAFLSMAYMIVYIVVAPFASWLVDSRGFRAAMGVGALISALFGMLRGVFASNFTAVTIFQIGVAIAQPFLVNSITKVAARWFPLKERATATGIATMATYVGMIVAMVLTPLLTENLGLERMLLVYGYAAVVCAVIFLVFSRERPPAPPGPGEELVNRLNLKDLRDLWRKGSFVILMACFFIVMGIFNAVMTWVENILNPRGISSVQAGLIGGLLVVAGLFGALVLPLISDQVRKRVPILVWSILAAIPGFLGLTFFKSYGWLLVSASIMGFFVMGMGPVGFQYGAEVAYPVPEGTSYGILMMMGQISGIIFIYVMDALRSSSGDMTYSLLLLIALMFVAFLLALRLKESALMAARNVKTKDDESEKNNKRE